jgi:hypothetical protein
MQQVITATIQEKKCSYSDKELHSQYSVNQTGNLKGEPKNLPDKLEFKVKLKKHLLGKLASTTVTYNNRLLCPTCHQK